MVSQSLPQRCMGSVDDIHASNSGPLLLPFELFKHLILRSSIVHFKYGEHSSLKLLAC